MRPEARAALHCCLILFFALGLIAQDAPKVSCPDSIRVVDPQLAKPLQGWKVSVGNIPHRLSRVTFYDGPVEADVLGSRSRNRRSKNQNGGMAPESKV